jgi:hypothetical protein
MATYNNVKYLSLPQQVEKNRLDIETLANSIVDGAVGPQGATGPRGPQGVIGNTGSQGIQGVNGTPVAGTTLTATADGTLGGFSITLNSVTPKFDFKRFVIIYSSIDTDVNTGIKIYRNGDVQTGRISVLDFLLMRVQTNDIRLFYYNENGEATTFIDSTTDTVVLNWTYAWSMTELVNGSTVGPAGAQGVAGATGAQGVTGPTGAQGIQGLPGLKNMAFLQTYVNEATFTPYAYRVMIQIVGGDYDGLIFIKETLVNGSTVKFGPYATLVTIETNGGVIQSILQNGVTSIRVYKIDNIS